MRVNERIEMMKRFDFTKQYVGSQYENFHIFIFMHAILGLLLKILCEKKAFE